MARNDASLKMAQDLGAHLTVISDEKAADEVKNATNGLGAKVIIDLVGDDATLAMAAKMARKQGQIVVVGLGRGTSPFRYGALPFGCTLISTLGGSTSEHGEVVALAEADRIKPQIEKFRLEQVVEVYQKLEKGQIAGRAVLVP